MLNFKESGLVHKYKHIRFHLRTKIFGKHAPISGRLGSAATARRRLPTSKNDLLLSTQLKNRAQSQCHGYATSVLHSKASNSLWGRSRIENLLLWLRGRQRQHFGPKARIPDLFQRRDQVYFGLETQRLQWYAPPPVVHHDLLDAAAKVGAIEARIGYTFNDKMMCIEAIKHTSKIVPLYFKGVVTNIDRNNRLALLGDRVLSLALCEIWFHTGHSTGGYSTMRSSIESRVALQIKGRALGFHKSLLISEDTASPTNNQIAETFEAILGAVYLDSGHSVEAVKTVFKTIELDDHEFLKSLDEHSKHVLSQKDLAYLRHFEEQQRHKDLRLARGRLQAQAKETKSQLPAQPHDRPPILPQTDESGPDAHSRSLAQEGLSGGSMSPVISLIEAEKHKSKSSGQEQPTYSQFQRKASEQTYDKTDKSRLLEDAPSISKPPSCNQPQHNEALKGPPKLQIEEQNQIQPSLEAKSRDEQAVEAGSETTPQRDTGERGTKAPNSIVTEEKPTSAQENDDLEIKISPETPMEKEAWAGALAKAARCKKSGRPVDLLQFYEVRLQEAQIRKAANQRRKEERAEKKAEKKAEMEQKIAERKAKKAEKEAQEQAEKEAQEKAEIERKVVEKRERKEKEAQEQAEKKVQEQAEKNAQEQAEKNAQEQAEKKVQEQAEIERKIAKRKAKKEKKEVEVAHDGYKQKAVASPTDIHQLEREIIESHHDAWHQVNFPGFKRVQITASLQPAGGFKQSQGTERREHEVAVQKGMKDMARKNGKPEEKSEAASKSRIQDDLDKMDTKTKDESDIIESETEELMANISKDDQEQQDAVRVENNVQTTSSPTAKPEPFVFSFDNFLADTPERHDSNIISAVRHDKENESVSTVEPEISKSEAESYLADGAEGDQDPQKSTSSAKTRARKRQRSRARAERKAAALQDSNEAPLATTELAQQDKPTGQSNEGTHTQDLSAVSKEQSQQQQLPSGTQHVVPEQPNTNPAEQPAPPPAPTSRTDRFVAALQAFYR